MKQAGILRNAADLLAIVFAKRRKALENLIAATLPPETWLERHHDDVEGVVLRLLAECCGHCPYGKSCLKVASIRSSAQST